MSLPDNLNSQTRGEPWYKDGVQFTCETGCTRCCGGAPGDVFISRAELDAIAAHLNEPVADFERKQVRHYPSGRMSLKERRNGECVLLTEEGCSVYEARPQQCRDFPFWPEVMKSVFSWIKEADRCPGINVGETHAAPKISEMLKRQ